MMVDQDDGSSSHFPEDSIPEDLASHLPQDTQQLKQISRLLVDKQGDEDQIAPRNCVCVDYQERSVPRLTDFHISETGYYSLTDRAIYREGDYDYKLTYPKFEFV